MKILITLLALFISITTQAEEKSTFDFKKNQIKNISIVAPEWPGYTNPDGTGLYWEILRAIYGNQDIKLKESNVSWNRAVKMVTEYQVYNGIIGVYLNTEEDFLYPKYPIDVEYLSVLSKNTMPEMTGYDSLTGKRVGWIKGYSLIKKENRDFTLREYRSIAQGIKLLNDDKIDYLIDEEYVLTNEIQAERLTRSDYNINRMPTGKDVFVGFANNDISKAFIEVYNKEAEALVKSGTMAAIYKKWNTDSMPESLIHAGK